MACSNERGSAFFQAKSAIEQDSRDVTIVFLGDSTGNAQNEFIWRFAEWLQEAYPNRTVTYRGWHAPSGTYNAPYLLGSGSGHFTHIYNASVPGANLVGFLGSRFVNAVANVPNVDMVALNFGLNLGALNDESQQRKSFLDGVLKITTQKPGVPIAIHLQQPFQNNNLMDKVVSAIKKVRQKFPGLTLVDTHSIVVAAGKPVEWYLPGDNTHFVEAGTEVVLSNWIAAWQSASSPTDMETLKSWVPTAQKINRLRNGSFTSASGSLHGWTVSGASAFYADTATKFPGKSHSVRLNGNGVTYIEQFFDAEQVSWARGKVLTVAARIRVAPNGPAYAGTVYAYTNGAEHAAQRESFRYNPGDGAGDWKINVVDDFVVPSDATAIVVRVYATANGQYGDINIDEVWMFEGAGAPLVTLP